MPELLISIKIKSLTEGGYLATSDELEGLVAQGRTVAETMEIAQDVARRLIESFREHGDPLPAAIQQAIAAQHKQRATLKIPVSVEGEH